MTITIQNSKEYLEALEQARNLLQTSHEKLLKSANRTSIEFRLSLGQLIEENSLRYDWGKSVLERFSEDLLLHFPNTLGLSPRNLGYMRQFYSEYKLHEQQKQKIY